MRYAFAVTAFLAVLLFSGCRSSRIKEETFRYPSNLAEAVALDWRRNAALETAAVEEMARQEALSRRRYHDTEARLAGFTGRDAGRMSNDPDISVLDNAAACAAVMLDAKMAEQAAKWRRYDLAVKNCAYLDYYRKLERAGVLTRQEREDYRFFLLDFEVGQGIDPLRAAEKFDFTSLRMADYGSYSSALPEWMAWNSKTPLLWTKLLLTLPQETVRTIDLDHSKLAAKVLEISRAVKATIARSHAEKLLQNPFVSAEPRLQAERELDLRLAAGAMAGVSGRSPGISREEEFIRDLYTLMQ